MNPVFPLIRIIQWREHGDDDDTITKRVVLSAEADEEITDHDYICAAYRLDPELDFDQGGITIVNELEISTGPVEDMTGVRAIVSVTKEEE